MLLEVIEPWFTHHGTSSGSGAGHAAFLTTGVGSVVYQILGGFGGKIRTGSCHNVPSFHLEIFIMIIYKSILFDRKKEDRNFLLNTN